MCSKIVHPSLLLLGAYCTTAVQITPKSFNIITEDSLYKPRLPPKDVLEDPWWFKRRSDIDAKNILITRAGSTATMELEQDIARRVAERHRQWCTKFPSFCALACDSDLPGHNAIDQWEGGIISKTEQPNARLLCLNATVLNYYGQCVANNDLRQFAEHVRTSPWIVHSSPAEGSRFDGGYCWYSGHCKNKNVTLDTTTEGANEICDNRFGKGKWTKTYSKYLLRFMEIGQGKKFHDDHEANIYAKASCGLGLYHCDVIRCQETLCKNAEYRQVYDKSLMALHKQSDEIDQKRALEQQKAAETTTTTIAELPMDP